MSLIEEAAKRLQLLHQAGIDMGMPLGPGAASTKRAPARKRPSRKTATPRRGKKLAAPAKPDAKLLEEFRRLKGPLVENALKLAAPASRTILVTSALPGEGKSFVAVNLAMSIAMDGDAQVLLVDAHLAAPGIARMLGIEESKGLAEFLTGAATLTQAVAATNIERLSLLLAGTPPQGDCAALLEGDAIARLLEEIRARYPEHIVVFDTPSLAVASPARALASQMGQVVVVAEAGRTTRAALEAALSAVESCPLVMTMLNKAASSELSDPL